jgi:hypothetical protein
MPESRDFVTVDVDAHVLEPRHTWQKYLEPKYRGDAIRIEKDAEGVEVLLVENKVHPALRGTLGAPGGIEMDSTDLMTVGQRSSVVWASDYPHLDASMGVVRQIRERIAGLPEVSQRRIPGENAARFFYGLSTGD